MSDRLDPEAVEAEAATRGAPRLTIRMRYRAALTLAALLTALTVAPAGGAATVDGHRLLGTVGPGFTITLTNAAGRRLVRVRAGSYVLIVRDRSRIHDFHLTGPGLDRVVTGVAFRGTKTLRVTLKPGRYRYLCDPHAFAMHGSFRVTR